MHDFLLPCVQGVNCVPGKLCEITNGCRIFFIVHVSGLYTLSLFTVRFRSVV